MKYINYNDSLVSLSNSILKNYQAKTNHKSLKTLDEALSKDYKNVLLILLDGLGTYNIEMCLDKNAFLRQHFVKSIHSVYPPTTTAATTSVVSALNPSEHCYLGWEVYFKDLHKNVALFPNTISQSDPKTDEFITDYESLDIKIAYKYFPFESIFDKICNKGVDAFALQPSGTMLDTTHFNTYDNFDNAVKIIKDTFRKPEKHFIYFYHPNPDHYMHLKGVDSKTVKDNVVDLNNRIANLCIELKDTLVVVIADHGHLNIESININDYPDIIECIETYPSIEPRTPSFIIKEGYDKKFVEAFNKNLSDYFQLYSKNEFIKKGFIGNNGSEFRAKEYLGDYIAVATKNKMLLNTKLKMNKFIGAHAGYTKEEMLIPLILIDTNKIT